MNRIFQILAISLFIIGFPLGSWYYLNKGYNYRIAIIKELDQQLGTIPNFELVNQQGEKVDQEHLQRKVVVTNFIDLAAIEQSKPYMETLYKIQDQFDKKDDILFHTYVKADEPEAVKTYSKSLEIKEEKQWYFLTGEDGKMEQLIQTYPLPENAQRFFAGNPFVTIADTSSTIRYFYDMRQAKSASKLIEHIANLMPQAPPEEARMKRELEK